MNYKINFDEPIADMITRLEREHHDFRTGLDRAISLLENNRNDSIEILKDLSPKIIQHAVEEEARLMRVIMEKAKAESEQSIHVMQEHNHVIDFIKHTLPQLHDLPADRIKEQVNQFVIALKEHFLEEEKIVFPLALKLVT
ncbi:MAG: hemerythrin domain-containing protein [Nitrosotalea sp.]